MKVIVLKHSNGERLPLLISARGFPLVEPNEFALTQRGLAWRTIKKKLLVISFFEDWAQANGINFFQRLNSGDFFSEAEINGSLFQALRKSHHKGKAHSIYVGAKTFNVTVMYVRQYLAWRFNSFLLTLPSSHPKFSVMQSKQQVVLGWLDNAKIATSQAGNHIEKGLTSEQETTLLELIDPASPNNPWISSSIRQRNYLLILILLNFGIRPSELLTLRVCDIEIGAISCLKIERRPHDPLDPRVHSPEVKRLGRILPIIDQKLARTIDFYILECRHSFESNNHAGSDFLFLSNKGDPLTYSSVSSIFHLLRDIQRKLPKDFSPKTMRHTFSSSMEKNMRLAGIDEIRRREILAYLRGDASEDSQRIYIKQAIREEAGLIMAHHQNSIFGR